MSSTRSSSLFFSWLKIWEILYRVIHLSTIALYTFIMTLIRSSNWRKHRILRLHHWYLIFHRRVQTIFIDRAGMLHLWRLCLSFSSALIYARRIKFTEFIANTGCFVKTMRLAGYHHVRWYVLNCLVFVGSGNGALERHFLLVYKVTLRSCGGLKILMDRHCAGRTFCIAVSTWRCFLARG